MGLHTKSLKNRRTNTAFRVSLRFKLAFPVLIFVSLMIFILFQTTFRTVSSLVLERNEKRLQAIAEVFAETVKVPLILDNQQVLMANIEWMAKRPDVLEIRVEDSSGVIVGGERPMTTSVPPHILGSKFLGVQKIGRETYAVAVPISAHDRYLGRVLILFTQQQLEQDLRKIFEERLSLALVLVLVLGLLTAGLTWFAIRPIFGLQTATQEILAGDLSARARINSLDEIQDLAEAFNEMVARLARSLDNLRARTEALEESEEKYRVSVENASDVILTLTPEGNLILINKGLSGCIREELLAKGLPGILELHTEASRAEFEEDLKKVVEHKKPLTNISLTHLHRGNQVEIHYLANLTPVLDHDGRIRLIHCVLRDVTELRQIEIMKESLIRDVAHELKTPTAKFEMALTWFEKQVQQDPQGKKYSEILDLLQRNADRLTRTITSIMDLSRLESGMAQVVSAKFDLREVMEQVYQDMEPLCRSKNLTLKKILSNGPLQIKGDRDMLYRLFVNLIGNAVKFTKKGAITLASELVEGHIRVSVTDTGSGIEREFLEKIFERFFQKSASSQGIGVGLTISRDIAALHQGRIWAESDGVGKGTTFKVEFPTL